MHLVLQPCGDSDAREHFVDTIQNKVPTERLRPILSVQDFDLLHRAFGESVAVWGVTPAKNLSNAKAWDKMERTRPTIPSQSFQRKESFIHKRCRESTRRPLPGASGSRTAA